MSALKDFLRERTEETRKVMISDQLPPFTVRSISQAENDDLTSRAIKRKNVKGQISENLDTREYTKRLVVACTVEPDFRSSEMCSFYGCVDPLDVPGKMLSVGEFKALTEAIYEINRLDQTAQEVVDEAKNS